ncbi:zinc-binding protein A33-like [Echeneis naucrates]|uniref:Zinc-binding protein A33-like n=1 Tax=Echeneis naucrates TaxID=173247 RepID=A0A665WC76_ECHNA|nr:zinc-binding protein A33-like [Echeneis naucrates]
MPVMACSRRLIPEENFFCSICLNVFTQPVAIPCGHNFCMECIRSYWDTCNTFPCPLCKQEFDQKPLLRVNTVIAEVAAIFKSNEVHSAEKSDEQTLNGNVFCSICTGAKVAALKSCLVCFMSFCEMHLKPHQTISAMKTHKLINPAENLESRICRTHGQPLELFCRLECMFLCDACKSDHKTHKIVTLEEEAEIWKTQLAKEKRSTDDMIHARQQKIQEFQKSLAAITDTGKEAMLCTSNVMTLLINYIRRSQVELVGAIETKQKKSGAEAEGFIEELEAEIMQLKQKSMELNQASLANDPLIFLEKVSSHTISQPQVKDWSDVTLSSDQFSVLGALAELETAVKREVRMLCDPDLKEKQQHAVDITLDPDTANPELMVSENRKQVTHGDRKRNVPKKPERFDYVPNVLAKESFSSGKFYFEVQVKDKSQWQMGVANGSINRKGDIRLSPKNGYWTICLRAGNEFIASACSTVTLPVRGIPEKIGVFVDYEEGEVSFYDVDAQANIFFFTGCNFAEPLFPFLSPCVNDKGKNSAPLIITPVKFCS